jgi:hypothetical protein
MLLQSQKRITVCLEVNLFRAMFALGQVLLM